MFKKLTSAYVWVAAVLTTWFWTVAIWAQVATPSPTPPPDAGAAVTELVNAVDLLKTGMWIAGILGVIKVIWFVIDRLPEKTQKKIKSYGIQTNVILGAAGTVLAVVAGGASWTDALIILFSTGLGSELIHAVLAIIEATKKKKKAEAKSFEANQS